MAPTIIRVKRKLDETQEVDSKIVLNCKKQKLCDKVIFQLLYRTERFQYIYKCLIIGFFKDVYSQFSFVGTVEEVSIFISFFKP